MRSALKRLATLAALGVGMFFLSLSLLPNQGAGLFAKPAVRVVTTSPIFADMIQQVGGDRVEVQSIVPVGTDPHAFDPTPREARAIAQADILFFNGYQFESWLQQLIDSAASPRLVRVQLSEGLSPRPLGRYADVHHGEHDAIDSSAHHGHAHGAYDPHFWLDVTYAMHYVERIAASLQALDPAGAALYAERAEAYLNELRELDHWIFEQINRIPPENRRLVAYHDAFGYMADRYGLQWFGAVVPNPEREPSPREVAELVRLVRELQIPAIFAEPQIHPRFVETLAREAGITVGTLYSDTLSAEHPTYIEMMRANALALVEGLSP